MMLRALSLCALLVLPAACNREGAPAPHATPAEPASAAQALDHLDGRTPLPLLPTMALHQKQEMRDHLLAVQEIVLALAGDDFAAVERAAARIGLSGETTEMCTHMGAAAPAFAEQALDFHRTADGIAAAAREGDRAVVLAQLGATLDACTTCHATWKQQIVDEATWSTLSSADPHDPGAAH